MQRYIFVVENQFTMSFTFKSFVCVTITKKYIISKAD